MLDWFFKRAGLVAPRLLTHTQTVAAASSSSATSTLLRQLGERAASLVANTKLIDKIYIASSS